jgi:steroid delta-isomerase-like uncharacterized protein
MRAENTTVVLRHHEQIWSKGDVDAVDEFYAADFVGHHPGSPDWIGRESVKLAVRMMHEAFPDFSESVEDVVAEGDRVATRFTSSGTQLGELRGIGPTGRRMSMAEFAIFRLAGGRIVEKWGLLDRLGMYQQLGVVPAPWPLLEPLYEITMDVTVLDVGPTPGGHRRIVRVEGGTFAGSRLRGDVLPGGGDWVLERNDGSRRLDVRVTLRTDDGALIYAYYGGMFHAPPDILQRLTAGEAVEESAYYFRTAPLFETASARYAWLNRLLAVGYGRRTGTQVAYSVYAIR